VLVCIDAKEFTTGKMSVHTHTHRHTHTHTHIERTNYLRHSLRSLGGDNYLRQVNEVNGGDNAFVRCVFVSVSVCVCARSGRSSELNANSSKTVKATDLKFDTRVPRDSPDMTQKFSQKGAWPRSRDHLNFCALNANSSKRIKATDFKFDSRVPSDSPDMTPKNFPKRGVTTVT